MALALGKDKNRRAVIQQQLIKAAEQHLFADMQAVREWELFFKAAIIAAARNQLLPIDWQTDWQIDPTECVHI